MPHMPPPPPPVLSYHANPSARWIECGKRMVVLWDHHEQEALIRQAATLLLLEVGYSERDAVARAKRFAATVCNRAPASPAHQGATMATKKKPAKAAPKKAAKAKPAAKK